METDKLNEMGEDMTGGANGTPKTSSSVEMVMLKRHLVVHGHKLNTEL